MKKASLILFSFAIISTLLLMACTNQSDKNKQTKAKKEEANLQALTLLQNNCFSCHNPDMNVGKRVAPPMFMVRSHYFDTKIKREDFVNNIIKYASNPTVENSIMPGAVRNFGLMPKQSFKEEDLKIIAEYIYDNDLGSDEWYAKWDTFKKLKIPQVTNLSYEVMGLNYANGTKSQLGKNLLTAIKEFGPAGAVKFCNTRAIPLTDSMAKVYNVAIKRVSDKPRNPYNKANETELSYINELKNNLSNGKKLAPKVIEKDGKMIGYYAIETNKMCMQCHGNKDSDISPETYQVIKKLYPKDMAFNYGENQIRGIWVVEMLKK